jgi:predicted alpha/beta-hydrolase family hydrolase
MAVRDDLLIDGSATQRTVVLAHGAGAPMDSEFMQTLAAGIAARVSRVVRFEFPYMQRRRNGGRRGAPDRQPVLLERWRSIIEHLGGGEALVIGGKSMGGRMASMIADDVGARGLLCLGYPFHPAGKPERLRVDHLADLKTPTLILQGTRDSLGNKDEITGYALSPKIRVEYLEDGDHSFKPRVRSGLTFKHNLERAIDLAAEFVARI